MIQIAFFLYKTFIMSIIQLLESIKKPILTLAAVYQIQNFIEDAAMKELCRNQFSPNVDLCAQGILLAKAMPLRVSVFANLLPRHLVLLVSMVHMTR